VGQPVEEKQMEEKTVTDKPLVSFCLIAYNQEQYIREAVKGAFAQTYSPLEIILSDDCSVDRTFEIMKEMAAEYKGSHTIILNRNEKNLGIAGHVNKVFSVARGEWFVLAAGDDISVPQRVERVAACFEAHPGVVLVQSNGYSIDESGVRVWPRRQNYGTSIEALSIAEFIKSPVTSKYAGALATYHRKLFEVFGPLSLCGTEDVVYPLRARLVGDLYYLDEPLVEQRVNGTSTVRNVTLFTDIRRLSWNYFSFVQFLEDLGKSERIDDRQLLVRLVRRKIKQEHLWLHIFYYVLNRLFLGYPARMKRFLLKSNRVNSVYKRLRGF